MLPDSVIIVFYVWLLRQVSSVTNVLSKPESLQPSREQEYTRDSIEYIYRREMCDSVE